MLRAYRADLHVHTCLSPCTDLEMSPQAIVRTASAQNIDILGICDHNSAENVPALRRAAEAHGIAVLAGLEVASQEEVHVLGLFDDLESALALQAIVYSRLPGTNDEEAFGLQPVVNEDGEVLRFNEHLLIGATTLSLAEVVSEIHLKGGIAIASHIDREAFGIIGQLGFIPENLPLDAVEVSPSLNLNEARTRFGSRLPLTASSDAHRLTEIGLATTSFRLADRTVAEIKKALKGEDGRAVLDEG